MSESPAIDTATHCYERVVFMQGEDADEALRILGNDGEVAVFKHLSRWHYPGEHETSAELGHGESDTVCRFHNYVMAYNTAIGYIGLEFEVKDVSAFEQCEDLAREVADDACGDTYLSDAQQ